MSEQRVTSDESEAFYFVEQPLAARFLSPVWGKASCGFFLAAGACSGQFGRVIDVGASRSDLSIIESRSDE